ncbi:MAG: virulence RhuM family protein [Clostridiales bacterium]|nr:virulence RhuM family protein [Clostridiales bacterium]
MDENQTQRITKKGATAVIRKIRITAEDGKTYNTNHYSLEMIIAVGLAGAECSERCISQDNKNAIENGCKMKMQSKTIVRGTYSG